MVLDYLECCWIFKILNLFSLDLGLGFGFGLRLGLGKRVRGKWGWGWRLKIYPWTGMEMKIIPANEGGPGMDIVFLSGYGDEDYTPRPRSGPLPSLGARYGCSPLLVNVG